MREILFRGKRMDNGEWVFGDIIQNIDCVKIREQENDIKGVARSYEVIPESVGQFTGILDKNGTKIFEGDIFKIGFHNYFTAWDNEQTRFTFMTVSGVQKSGFNNNTVGLWEVIGNIHDNPELLEV